MKFILGLASSFFLLSISSCEKAKHSEIKEAVFTQSKFPVSLKLDYNKPKNLIARIKGCKEPESAYFDEESGFLFVSNINGAGDAKDQNGWISRYRVSSLQHSTTSKWITGLNAPKGMRSHEGILWVSDIDTLVAIDIETSKVISKTKIDGAKFLNDIAITDTGEVYVSDTIGSSIYQLKSGKITKFVSGDEFVSPNGLAVEGDKLIVAAWGLTTDWSTKKAGHIYSVDLKSKEMTRISKEEIGNLDGIEKFGVRSYLISDWVAGTVSYVHKKSKPLLIYKDMKGSADIGYHKKGKLIAIPRMGDNVIDILKSPL